MALSRFGASFALFSDACIVAALRRSDAIDLVNCNLCEAKTTSYYDVCRYNQLLRLTGWPVNRR